MANIKFQLVKFDKKIAFEILEQINIDEGTSFKTNTGVTVTAYYPFIEAIKENKLYIRSTERKGYDTKLSIQHFSSNDERDIYYTKILETLKDFSQNYKH